MNRGIATGKASMNRYHAKSKDSEGISSTELASTRPSSPAPRAPRTLTHLSRRCRVLLQSSENRKQEKKGKERGKSGKGRSKGLAGRLGTGKPRLLDAGTLIDHYSDPCFKYQKQQRFERLKAFLKQQGSSEEDAMKVLSKMKNCPQFADNKPSKPAAKLKPAAKPAPVKLEEREDPAATKRNREPQFAKMERIVELLR